MDWSRDITHNTLFTSVRKHSPYWISLAVFVIMSWLQYHLLSLWQMTFLHRLKFVLFLICCMQHALTSNSASNSSANVSTISNGKRQFCILKSWGQQNENLTVWGKVGIWVSRDMSLKKLWLIFNFSLSCFLLFSRFLFYTIIFFLCEIVGISTFLIKTVIVRFTESLFHSCSWIN